MRAGAQQEAPAAARPYGDHRDLLSDDAIRLAAEIAAKAPPLAGWQQERLRLRFATAVAQGQCPATGEDVPGAA